MLRVNTSIKLSVVVGIYVDGINLFCEGANETAADIQSIQHFFSHKDMIDNTKYQELEGSVVFAISTETNLSLMFWSSE